MHHLRLLMRPEDLIRYNRTLSFGYDLEYYELFFSKGSSSSFIFISCCFPKGLIKSINILDWKLRHFLIVKLTLISRPYWCTSISFAINLLPMKVNKFTNIISTKVVCLFLCQTLKLEQMSNTKTRTKLENNMWDVQASYIQESWV
jgi:predicted neutral ceramidase superfamily lipid hydrolase